MDTEVYLDLDTVVHRLDPRTKILIFVAVFASIVFIDHPLWLFPFSLLVVIHGLVSRSLGNLRRIRYLLILLSTWGLVLWSLFVDGQTKLFWIFELEAIEYAISRTLLILSFIASGMILLSTTRNEELVLGMIKLGLPYRVGFAISTALRMVPTIIATTATIAQAQRSRGLDLDSGGFVERIRKNVPLLIPVFVSTIRGTNVLGMALESKGFGARPERTFYLETRFRRDDYVCMAFLVIVFAVATYVRLTGMSNIPGLIRF